MRRERESAAAALVIAFISILLPFYFCGEEESVGNVPEETGAVTTVTAISSGVHLAEKDETMEQDPASASPSGSGQAFCPGQSRDGKNMLRQMEIFLIPILISSAVLFKGCICSRCRGAFFPASCFLRDLRIRLKKDGKKWMTVLSMQECRTLCTAQ